MIVISAQNTIMTAIQAAEADAYDYLPKPFDLPDLMKRASKALETKRRAPATRPSSGEPSGESDDLPLVGRTPVMQALYRLVESDPDPFRPHDPNALRVVGLRSARNTISVLVDLGWVEYSGERGWIRLTESG